MINAMEVQVKNLGPIQDAQVSIKPLTVFVGPNNSGKTYLSYLIYGLIKNKSELFKTLYRRRKLLVEVQEGMINKGLKEGRIYLSFNLLDVIYKNRNYLKMISKSIEEKRDAPERFVSNFWRFIGSDREECFKDLKVQITLKGIDPANINSESIRGLSFEYFQVVKFKQSYTLAKVYKKVGSENLSIILVPRYRIYLPEENLKEPGELSLEPSKFIDEINVAVNRVLLGVIFRILFPLFTLRPIVFPAQRNTLMLDSIYSAINIAAREEIVFEKNSILVTYSPEKLIKSRPIIDFLNMIDRISGARLIKGPLFKLGEKLEKVLGGKLVVDKSLGRWSVRFVAGKNEINLQTSSSMVQQLSSLVIYLKYFARPGDIIVIDEPESNLHPEAQLKIAEILAKLVNHGIWVIITTHSPYILDHLNNLMAAFIVKNNKYGYDAERMLKEKGILFEEDSLLNPAMVAAYLTVGGKVEPIMEEDYINWETFGKVSDLLSRTYSKILEVSQILEGTSQVNGEEQWF